MRDWKVVRSPFHSPPGEGGTWVEGRSEQIELSKSGWLLPDLGTAGQLSVFFRLPFFHLFPIIALAVTVRTANENFVKEDVMWSKHPLSEIQHNLMRCYKGTGLFLPHAMAFSRRWPFYACLGSVVSPMEVTFWCINLMFISMVKVPLSLLIWLKSRMLILLYHYVNLIRSGLSGFERLKKYKHLMSFEN